MRSLLICKQCDGVPAPPLILRPCSPCGGHLLAWDQKAYMGWLAGLNCSWCTNTAWWCEEEHRMITVQVHHEWIYGGQTLSKRDPDHHALPLCIHCHERRTATSRDIFWDVREPGHMLQGMVWLLQACYELEAPVYFTMREPDNRTRYSPTWVTINGQNIAPEWLVAVMEFKDRKPALEMVKELMALDATEA